MLLVCPLHTKKDFYWQQDHVVLFLRLLLPPRGSIIRPSNVLLWLGYLFIVWFFRASDTVFENTVVVGAAATQVGHGCVCARPVATQINSCVIPCTWLIEEKYRVATAIKHRANTTVPRRAKWPVHRRAVVITGGSERQIGSSSCMENSNSTKGVSTKGTHATQTQTLHCL